MSRYFVAVVEGEAPDDMDRQALREALTEALPEWAGVFVDRLDEVGA